MCDLRVQSAWVTKMGVKYTDPHLCIKAEYILGFRQHKIGQHAVDRVPLVADVFHV